MKKIMISMIALSCLSACNVMDVNARETTNQKFAREQREDKAHEQAEKTAAAQAAGGQPGKISVKGVVVFKNQVNDHIQISQYPGAGANTDSKITATSIDKNSRVALSSTTDSKATDQLADDKNYVALGCKDIDASSVSGLSKKNVDEISKTVASVSANTVFLCGKAEITYQYMTIATHNLVLMNAEVLQKNSAGSLSLTTDTLTVLGKNKIQTQGLDSPSSVPAAPALELTVLKSIDGDGSLQLNSIGGSIKK